MCKFDTILVQLAAHPKQRVRMLTCHKDDADNNVHDVMIIIVSINIIIVSITMAIIVTRTSSLWHFIRAAGFTEKEGPCLTSTSQPNLVMKIAMTMMTTMLTKMTKKT